MPGCRSVTAAAAAGPAMGRRMGSRMRPAWLLGWRLPVQERPFDVHAELAHFLEAFGSDVVLLLTVDLFFRDPLQLFCRFNKDTSDGKRIDWSETVLVFALGCHLTPLVDDGKIQLSSFLFVFRNL